LVGGAKIRRRRIKRRNKVSGEKEKKKKLIT